MPAPGSNQTQESLPEIFRREMEASERENREQWKHALVKSLAAIDANPKSAEAYLEAAHSHRKLKDFPAAIEMLGDGIERCEFHLGLHVSYIHLLAQCNKTHDAIAAAHEALAHA